MKLPVRKNSESKEVFVTRSYNDEVVKSLYPSAEDRLEYCLVQACETDTNPVTEVDFIINAIDYGWAEEITEDNWFVPSQADYEEGYDDEETEDWDISVAKPGLWENIRKKKEREGKNYKPAKKGDKDRPDPDAWKKAQSKDNFKPHTMYDKDGKPHQAKTLEDHLRMEKQGYTQTKAAEYQGRKVKLGKPFRTPGGPKKSAVYVKNDKGKVVIVRFGDPNMKIKKNDPGRRKNFRARHNCSNPGPRWKARYWSCRAW
jgi:hypothetical protein